MIVGMDEFMTSIIRGSPPSGWMIDIYNCHGVLKPDGWAGYGIVDDEILKKIEDETGVKHLLWYNTGYYSIALTQELINKVREENIEDIFRERLERVLSWIIEYQNGGAINISGFYTVTVDEMNAIQKTIQRVIYKSKMKEDYSMLKYIG